MFARILAEFWRQHRIFEQNITRTCFCQKSFPPFIFSVAEAHGIVAVVIIEARHYRCRRRRRRSSSSSRSFDSDSQSVIGGRREQLERSGSVL